MRRRAVIVLAALVAMTGSALGFALPANAASLWQPTSTQTYWLLDALQRSQGVTTDGQIWYFSWQFGLSRVSLDGNTTLSRNPFAIPPALLAEGDNHIGDIDYYKGKLYVSIEDGKAYQHPHVAVYDAATLAFTGTYYTLPQAIQVDGVPWVAVDPVRGYILSSEYNAVALNEYSLTDGHLVRQVPLSQPIPELQGAKIYQGQLYGSSNGPSKSVFRVDPDTGVVTDVLDPGLPSGTETEGLAFLPRPDGSVMHVLDVSPNRISVNFRHYQPS